MQPVNCKLLAHQELEAETKPDIAIRIRTLVVEIQRAQASIAGIVAIATTNRES